MSIRIYTDGLASAAASEASRNEELSRAGAAGKPNAGPISDGLDQVQISSLSESIAAGSSRQDAAQAQRVSQIAAQYANGTYHVDSLQLSRAMVSNAIGSSGVEKG
jgi:anti-sigma28 factor (negative regulator of flagellin synthesis)